MISTTLKTVETLDAVVLGAGFAGLAMLHKLQNKLGLKAKILDKAGGVGGTWYWNRYPGARSDTESWVYCYSFDATLYREWKWTERYPRGSEILSYLEHVADRFDLRKNIMLNTLVTKAHWNEQIERWDIETAQGDRFSAKYLITGLGILSAANKPKFKGEENFKGTILHTANWPTTPVDFTGKRVGVIGNGSTGIQVMAETSKIAKELVLYQRTPQYSVPARNHPIDPAFLDGIADNLDGYFDRVRRSATVFAFEEATKGAMDVSPETREAVYEKAWQDGGGFNFMFGTFNDIAVNRESNATACDFIRKKIAEVITDPVKCELMTPTDLYARRPLCDNHFYEAINQDNVRVLDIKKHPIIEFTDEGIRTAEGEVKLDYVIFATGFDAVTGNFVRIDFQGRNGLKMSDHWANGPRAFLGLSAAGFPNMFSLYGPPGPFTNQPPAIEWQAEWVSELIKNMMDRSVSMIEATPEAEQAWLDECISIEGQTLFGKIDWWVSGANIPGKTKAVSFYMGGFGEYMKHATACAANNYDGYIQSGARTAMAAE
ncbi:NAD(P)/FAD-dependent oxidoreductase [Pararhizobium sp. YC-54]|uniref:flavin-containing monooxygenase n=1 Tax=Pararhizobium sp. YC-54 TaxID=2986920 RepID=UPI0021F70ED0|nr:NAD(P)/FAD-dependent oxidoreductase [Pararhizobium sp. YC-54]MCV9999644.1 NAD(P)/FAD-dependent oxidoreductase [Pararhizobium sp. YC-54]